MSFKEAFSKLKTAVGDISSLDVKSYSGTLTANIHGDNDGSIIDWEKLVSAAKEEQGSVSLKLASHFNFDGDATLFVADSEIPTDLRAAHDDAVKAGQQIRSDLFELFSEGLKKLI